MSINVEQLTPYGDTGSDKKQQVRHMFNNIAPAYDFLNRFMTLRLDTLWRRATVKSVEASRPRNVLDLATGTADLAIATARRLPQVTLTAADISPRMLDIARHKIQRHGLQRRIDLVEADGTCLPFASDTFDCATIGFGIRNFASLHSGYAELFRVLRPGGHLLVLELATPANPLTRALYKLYTRTVIPLAGRLVSRDAKAYTYLPQSVAQVPQRHQMLNIMKACGFEHTAFKSLMPGTAILYTAIKPQTT